MPASQYIRLLSQDAATKVRSALTATDAGTWTPEDEGTPKDFILDAREWDTIRLTPVFLDAGGAIANGTSINAIPLIMVPDARSTTGGRLWRELPPIGVTPDDEFNGDIPVQGHFCAFRLSGLTLGGTTSVDLIVTGGKKRLQAGNQ